MKMTMKKAKEKKYAGGQGVSMPWLPDRQNRFRWILFVLLGWITFTLTPGDASAQCILVCQPAPLESPREIAVNQNCAWPLTPDFLLDMSSTCPGDKLLTVTTTNNLPIAQGTNSVLVDLSGRIGQIVKVRIQDVATGLFCEGYGRVVDQFAPVITCRDTAIVCTADTSVANLGLPQVMENCGVYTLTHKDDFEAGTCADNYVRLIKRRWIVRDQSGNADTCVQMIRQLRPILSDIVFPRDTTLSCDQPFAQPDSVGYPLLQGKRIQNSGLCGLSYRYQDDTTRTCDGIGMTIVRTWTVIRACDGSNLSRDQVIRIKDSTAPIITCPAPMTFSTTPGVCGATVLLRAPTIRDNCDPMASFTVSTPFGMGLGPHFNVPPGTYTAQYTAYDRCGNSSVCSTTFTVVDNSPPVAVCDESTAVSLSNGGLAFVQAKYFDNGSKDNCNAKVYFKVRRMDIGACQQVNGDDNTNQAGYQEWFDDYVAFCCADMEMESVRVIMRVYEVDPGPGPVDPTREEQGGDLFGHYNECMVRVIVQEKLSPTIECPANTTVACDADLTDLSRFGTAVAFEACGFDIDSTFRIDRAECGTGFIYRTWTATDFQENKATCTQTIEIVNNYRLVKDSITWPQDVVLTTCGSGTDPDDLPLLSQRPKVNAPGCVAVSINSKDNRYEGTASPACFKIFRTWTVTDLCRIRPGSQEGIFTFTQEIAVKDNTPPVITCLQDVTVELTNGCTSAQVTVPNVTATDNCSTEISITNNSPYATAKGANASGVYPLGTTTVTFRATDGCGNVSICMFKITVVDKKPPSPICLQGLSQSLTMMPGGPLAMVSARIFDKGSFDPCAANPKNIKITIRRANLALTTPPTDTMLTFTCADIGRQFVHLWATDVNGNGAFCETYIDIQDNGVICPIPATVGRIAGTITTSQGVDVENVSVAVQSTQPLSTMTNAQGSFTVDNLPLGKSYSVVPKKNDDVLNGVSTIDLILLSKHILGVQLFDSPYKYIAADIDRSGTISTLDVIKLRKLILGRDTELGNGNTSWRFIDDKFVFPAGVNPLQANFPELKNLDNFNTQEAKVNFIGIKVGDINGSATPNSLVVPDSRSTGGELIVRIRDKAFRAGEVFTVDLTARDLEAVMGYQFSLDYDEDLLTLLDYQMGELPGMGSDNLAVISEEEGRLTTSWNGREGLYLPGWDHQLMRLTFRARRDADLINAIALTSQPTKAEAYTHTSELMSVLLQFTGPNGVLKNQGGYALYQNYPNPFSSETHISFALPTEMDATIKVFDVSGRVIYQHQARFPRGYNEMPLRLTEVSANGVFYYQLETADFTAVRKMIMTPVR
ncbi:MAG: HYR domain-containing protein [Lewinellaceae bacterium]|nr:HYR domain-containing protein [Lewinellaceae bacterium]